MYAEMVVYLLEQHLEAINESLGDELWGEFIKELEKCSEGLLPKRKDLDSWTDKVTQLCSKYAYTKGLIEGLCFYASLATRGIPSAYEYSKDKEQPRVLSAKFPPGRSYEESLVDRIQSIVIKARSLK